MKPFSLKNLTLLLLLILVTQTARAEVNAFLNQSSFYEGDPITLKIESTINNNAKPDLLPLEKDFSILATGTSSQTSIINGQRSFKKVWTIELQPKVPAGTGGLIIPPITIGNEQTKAVGLSIMKLPPEVTAETNKHIFLEANIGTPDGPTFVQQQIPYTLKLFYDASMQTAEIASPIIENAIIEKLGDDKRYQITRAGKRFNVVERHFVISPEKSGTLRIPPVDVTGRIALSGGDSPSLRKRMDETDMLNNFFNDSFFNNSFNSPFGNFFSNRSRGPSKPFKISSDEINVEVLPVPSAFTGSAWLPAEDIIIQDSWTQKPPSLQVGAPITRTLTLQAKGLAGSQIPDINFAKPNNLKSYPEKAKSETRTDGKTVYGIQQTEITYIPDVAGKVTIPKVEIDWWDVKNRKQRTFVLPEWNLNVATDPNSFVDASGNTAQSDQGNSSSNSLLTSENKPKNIADTHVESNKNEVQEENLEKTWNWKKISAFFIIFLVVTILIYRFIISKILKKRSASSKTRKPINSKSRKHLVTQIRAALQQACQNNDKNVAATKLIALVQAQWQDDSIQNLGSIASQLEKGSDIVHELEESLYRADNKPWNGKALSKLIEDGLQQKQRKENKSVNGLTPLYPS